MKLRIVSDGTCRGTYLESEGGERIDGVIRIDWHHRDDRYMALADIQMIGVPVELAMEAGAVTCECGKLNPELVCLRQICQSVDRIYGPQPETCNTQPETER